ncbi:MAG: hypothetical protein AMS15_07760 [Planctomycetes bacterium DG_23]|nr:MAG: hypothetical protein AMS15_07760 [Planctomycetes bacterium DG_23]
MELFALIMAGGVGTRFWPKSRKQKPKQLLPILARRTLLEDTIERLEGLIPLEDTFIITTAEQLPVVKEAVASIPEENIVPEPEGRDTAPCIGLGVSLIAKRDPEATIAVLPADHHISPTKDFQRTLSAAASLAESSRGLITFGISPTYPATGYGYIHRGKHLKDFKEAKAFKVAEFKEKPDKKTAKRFLRSGEFYWNSGIFVWQVPTILSAIKEHLPSLYRGLETISASLGTSRQAETIRETYPHLPKISIDYGVLEKAKNVLVIEANYKWDDLGAWPALVRLRGADDEGNTILAKHIGIDTKDTLILAKEEHLVATIGTQGLIIIQTPDATLVVPKARAQEVKDLVEKMKEAGLKEYL